MNRTVSSAAVLLAALGLGACGQPDDGCHLGRGRSLSLDPGQSRTTDVVVTNGRPGSGSFTINTQAYLLPRAPAVRNRDGSTMSTRYLPSTADGTYRGRFSLAGTRPVLDIEGRTFTLEGPIGCY